MNEIIESNSQSNNELMTEILFNDKKMDQIMRFAEMMSGGKTTVPKHLRGSVGDCMAITMQAMRWRMDPFAVAQKTHLVNGTLGYEAQLVNAVITSSKAVQGRFHYEYIGDWSILSGYKAKKEKYTRDGQDAWRTVKTWPDEKEQGLGVRVGAKIIGEDEITWGETLFLSTVNVRNSPLWVDDPKQQIAYLAVKRWSRLYTPALIMGVYTPDELEELPKEARDITTQAERINEATEMMGAPEPLLLSDFEEKVKSAKTLKELRQAGEDGKMLSDADRDEALLIYEKRAAELRIEAENKRGESNAPKFNALDILKLIDRAKNNDDLQAARDLANGLPENEIKQITIAFDKRCMQIAKGE